MINIESGVGIAEKSFSEIYFKLNKEILLNGEMVSSRNGDTREFLNFKTILKNPRNRCVGGNFRNINIFFLLAEAIWIAYGRKDVEFLDIFNSNLKNYSDDGRVYHAPYGFRMRHWGVRAEDRPTGENLHAFQGVDQIGDIIKILHENPESRQAVVSIWNTDLDLGVCSKDIPCNDIIMFKIRNKKLYTTIQNRSNDLHWGLCTNIFQFSFLSEIIASCLGIEIGEQVHNSQSLHVYLNNPIGIDLFNLEKDTLNLYDISESKKIDFNYTSEIPILRLREIDFHLNNIIYNLSEFKRNLDYNDKEFLKKIKCFSEYLEIVYRLLKIYIEYKKTKNFQKAVSELDCNFPKKLDIVVLAENFFNRRFFIDSNCINFL